MGDYVQVGSSLDVWTVVSVADGRALLSPSSINLAGRGRRSADLHLLRIVRPAQVRTVDIDEAF